MKRGGYWFLVTGLILGVAASLAYAWLASPVSYVDMAPFSLNTESKDEYRALVAAAFAANGDLPRAQARLEQLRDDDPQQALAAQAQRIVANQGSYASARSLALLAVAVRQVGQTLTVPPAPLPTMDTPVVTPQHTTAASLTAATTPAASATPAPVRRPTSTLVPTATAGPPFVVAESAQVCDSSLLPALLQVRVADTAGKPVPGVQVIVTWADGEDIFYTGLKPAFGDGYADFEMEPGVEYSLHLAEGGQPVGGISVGECPAEGGNSAFPAGWAVLFTQP